MYNFHQIKYRFICCFVFIKWLFITYIYILIFWVLKCSAGRHEPRMRITIVAMQLDAQNIKRRLSTEISIFKPILER